MTSPLCHHTFLLQTDTTVGFLSQDADRLARIKSRPKGKPFLKVYANLHSYKASGGRIPISYRSQVRRAKATTFIVKGQAFRIVSTGHHHYFLRPFGWMYSTSANQSGQHFDRHYCEENADIIIEDAQGLHEATPSSLMCLGRTRCRRLR